MGNSFPNAQTHLGYHAGASKGNSGEGEASTLDWPEGGKALLLHPVYPHIVPEEAFSQLGWCGED